MAQQDDKKQAQKIANNTIANSHSDSSINATVIMASSQIGKTEKPLSAIVVDAQEEPAQPVKFSNELIGGVFVAVYK